MNLPKLAKGTLRIVPLGGIGEIGRNMTVFELNGKLLIVDCGVLFPEEHHPGVDVILPDFGYIEDRIDDVIGLVLTHGHEDHIGGVPYLLRLKQDIPILGSSLTLAFIEAKLKEHRITPFTHTVSEGQKEQMAGFDLEFIAVNHSIPDATLSYLKTPEGGVIYGNDMKFDRRPVIGENTDIDRLKEVGEDGIELMIPGTTSVDEDGRVPPEEAVKVELENVLNASYEAGGAVIVTTFSSQIARLNSILEANDGRRKVAFVGRSLKEYTKGAEECGLIDLSDVEVVSYFDECEDLMRKVDGEREEWLVVATGNQGEPGAQMDKIASGTYPFDFEKGDHVIFSSRTIPTPPNKANRYKLEKKLSEQGVRLYKEIHTSGHAKKEDHRDFITYLQPEHIIPSHGHLQKLGSYVELAREEGYSLGDDVHLSENGKVIELN